MPTQHPLPPPPPSGPEYYDRLAGYPPPHMGGPPMPGYPPQHPQQYQHRPYDSDLSSFEDSEDEHPGFNKIYQASYYA